MINFRMSQLDFTTNKTLVDSNQFLLKNIEMFNSDIVEFSFLGTNEILKAHKLIIAKRSEVFYKMFFGALPEEGAVDIPDASFETFKKLIHFIYTDEADLSSDSVAEVMILSHKYMIHGLEEKCVEFIRDNLNPKIVGSFLESSYFLNSDNLKKIVVEYVGRNTFNIINEESFPNCSKFLLNAVLNLDELYDCQEMDLITATLQWAKEKCKNLNLDVTVANQRHVLEDNFFLLRFPTLRAEEFTSVIADNVGLFELDEVVSIYQWIILNKKIDGLKFLETKRKIKFNMPISIFGPATPASPWPSTPLFNFRAPRSGT